MAMSEEAGITGGLDAKQFVHIPANVKIIILSFLVCLSAVSITSSIIFMNEHKGVEEMIYSLFVAQTSTAGMILIVLISFASRDENMGRLVERSDNFIESHVFSALGKISAPEFGIKSMVVKNLGKKDLFGNAFVLQSGVKNMKIWVGLNVTRLIIVYFVPVSTSEAQCIDRLKEIFLHTFSGAMEVGYKIHYQFAQIDGEKLVSIWCSAVCDNGMLTSPTEKLFWSQDIAMMTESFMRAALRADIDIDSTALPGPL